MSEALYAAIDAKAAEAKALVAKGFLRRASAELRECAELLTVAAEKKDGLLSDSAGNEISPWEVGGEAPAGPQDLQMCARGVHADGPINNLGQATCRVCGRVNLFPKDPAAPAGPIQMR